MKIILRPAAQNAIRELFDYLCQVGYPDTAVNFTTRLQAFINSLSNMPERVPLCRFKLFAKRNLHCAVFNRSWIVVFSITNDAVIVRNLIHTSRLAD